jgi:formylglycine-generating enzyme required for sulfatase activity
MTTSLPLLLGFALLAALSAAPGSRSERRDVGLVALRTPVSRAVYLRPLTLDLGSTEEEALSALLRCKREPLSERCDETTFAHEVPVRRSQHVAGFWMARTEVSVAEYARCVAAGRCAPAGYEGGAQRFQRANLPVTLVSFDDARHYCAFRAGRLPTEAEFERAARGAARRAYPWGRSFHGKLANHGRLGVDPTDASDGYAELAPVGSFPGGATPEGILDLAGNVAEWAADAFEHDDGRPINSERVVRGGHFASAAPFLRGAARAGKPPGTREPTLGFRCVWQVRPLDD